MGARSLWCVHYRIGEIFLASELQKSSELFLNVLAMLNETLDLSQFATFHILWYSFENINFTRFSFDDLQKSSKTFYKIVAILNKNRLFRRICHANRRWHKVAFIIKSLTIFLAADLLISSGIFLKVVATLNQNWNPRFLCPTVMHIGILQSTCS
jgi:p-aminobenzoyl-glutamate transporter AbgT